MNKSLLILTLSLAIWSLPAILPAAAKGPSALPPLPGTLQQSGGNIKIILEGNRQLLWPTGAELSLQQLGMGPITINLKATPKTSNGAEALGLEVEEVDLGGGAKSGRYLQHKKQPKGRSLDPKTVGEKPEAADMGTTTQKNIQGIPVTHTQFANGATRLGWNWGKTQEEAFFDRRKTLISVELSRKAGDTEYRLKQWADGSFSRSYVRPQGEVHWIYDALSANFRLRVANGQGQTVQDLSCDPKCSLEN